MVLANTITVSGICSAIPAIFCGILVILRGEKLVGVDIMQSRAPNPLAGLIQIQTVVKGLSKDKSVKKENFGKKCKTASYGRSQCRIFFFFFPGNKYIYFWRKKKKIIGYFLIASMYQDKNRLREIVAFVCF